MEKETEVQKKLNKIIFDTMTEIEKINELKKCEDLLYFYNTYLLPDGAREVTREEYNHLMSRRNSAISLKLRAGGEAFLYPLTPDETFESSRVMFIQK